MPSRITARRHPAAVALSSSVAVAVLLAALVAAAPAPAPPARVRLTNPVKITLEGVDVDAVAMLADNESIVVVGGKPHDPDDKERARSDYPPAGAIVNFRTKAVRPFTNGHRARIDAVAVSADGSRIVTVCSNLGPLVRVWDVKTAAPLRSLSLPQLENYSASRGATCLPGGSKVAVSYKGCIALLDTAGRDPRRDLKGGALEEDDTPDKLVVSPDGKFLACIDFKCKVGVWDVRSGKSIRSIDLVPAGEDAKGWSSQHLAFTRDGKGLLACLSGKEDDFRKGIEVKGAAAERRGMLLIDIASGKITPLNISHQVGTFGFALHSSGEWLATVGPSRPDKPPKGFDSGQIGELRIYHYTTRALSLRVQFDDGFFPSKVRFTPDGRKLVAVDVTGKLRAWDFTPAKK